MGNRTLHNFCSQVRMPSLPGVSLPTWSFLAGVITLNLFVAALSAPMTAEAQISVDNVIMTFSRKERPVRNVVVRNSGDAAVYITVQPDVMIRPGFEDEERVETGDLIASPKRFSLAAGGERTVRLLVKKPPQDEEQVYRVKFLPQAKEFGEELVREKGKTKTMLKVIFSVGILVFVEPKELKPHLKWERNGSTVTFQNAGNVNIFLDEGKYCSDDGEDSCESLPGTRLYPGNIWSVTIPGPKAATYRKKAGGEFETIVIN